MRIIKFILLTGLFCLIIFLLNKSWGAIPPPGKFFHPYTGFMQNATPVESIQKIEFENDEIEKKATIVLDEYNIPHIFAETEHDVYYLQGYITAMERLWQMDMQTRSAAGRLSEVVGKKTLSIDREKRRLGLYEAAEKSAQIMLQGESGESLISFTKGVNAFIRQLKQKDYPIEFKLLNYEPENWTPTNSALLLKLMAERLTANETDIENTNFVKLYGQNLFDLLFPSNISGGDPIVPIGTAFNFQVDSMCDMVRWNGLSMGIKKYQPAERQLGSNNWAIQSSKSKTGNPILCNDPHLSLKYPNIWFEVHLVCPGLNVYGVTLPGAPGVIIGFNEQIAWGLTNAGRDVRIWYALEYGDRTHRTYIHEGTKKSIQYKYHRIKIRGEEDFVDTVGYTHHGPIINDERFQTTHQDVPLALSWTAYIPSNELKTFYALNRAKTIKDYEMAIQNFVCPGQNFVFASKSGDIAIKQQGLFPYSKNGEDRFILDGRWAVNDMKYFIPSNHNPYVVNPERGFVSSANQHPTDLTYPYLYAGGEFEYNRNRRINEVLASKDKLTIKDMMLLQQDELNYTAKDLLPKMMNILNANQKLSEVGKSLSNWNYFNREDSRAAVYFELWLNHLQAMVYDEFKNSKYPILKPDIYVTSQLIKDNRDIDLFDMVHTRDHLESMHQMIAMSFDSTLDQVLKLKTSNPDTLIWSGYKSTEITHLAMIPSFGDYKLKTGGRANIVNAISKTWGPSWRMIVELTPNGPKAYGIYPGGQSGNPGSAHYNEFTEAWRTNSYKKLIFAKHPKEIKNALSTIFINN